MNFKDKLERVLSLQARVRDLEHDLRVARRDVRYATDGDFLMEIAVNMPAALSVNWRMVECFVRGEPYRPKKVRREE